MPRRRHNSQTERDRQRLIEDFERRLRYDETAGDRQHWLSRPKSMAWVVHPCADEAALLAELGTAADAFRSVDAYWRYGDNVYFVQVLGANAPTDQPHICYRFDTAYRQDQFVVVLPTRAVRTHDLHDLFEHLERLVDSGVVVEARRALRVEPGRWLGAVEPLMLL